MNPIRNLSRRPGRTALTVAGVSIAVIMLVVMLSISNGMQKSSETLVKDRGVDIFITGEGGNMFMGGSMIYNGTAMAEDIIEKNPEIREIGLSLEGIYLFSAPKGRNSTSSDVTGTYSIGKGDMKDYDIIEGDFMPHRGEDPFRNSTYYREWNITQDAFDSPDFTHECTISQSLSEEFDLHPGDTIYISHSKNMSHNLSLTVYGVFVNPYDSSGSKEIDMHLSELQFFLDMKNDPVSAMYVDLHDPSKATEVADWINENYPLSAISQEEFISQINKFMRTFDSFSIMISSITVLVGAIFISTIMDIAVRERRREIAAMRAIGISRTTIVTDIFTEGISLIFLAFILGTLLGLIIAYGLDAWMSTGPRRMPSGFHLVSIDAILIAKVFLISMALGILSSVIPARWATKINISDALRGD